VHDELVIDCPENEVEEVSKLLKDEMEHAYDLAVPLTVDVNVGRTWFDTK
jgi:DNA polymerase-1